MAAPSRAPRHWEDDVTRMWTPRPGGPHGTGQLPPVAPAAQASSRVGWMFDAERGRALLLRGLLVLTAAVTLFAGAAYATDWLRVRLDDLRFGRPRTTQLSAFVGHNEGSGMPTQLLAVNLNRRITVIEIPGSDPARLRAIAGPYLVGRDEDLTTATMRLLDVNGDNHPDLLLRVKNEELVYMNDRGEFRLMTPEERPQVERMLGGAR